MTAIPQFQIDAIIHRRMTGEHQAQIASALGIGQATVNRYCKKAALEGKLGFKPVMDGFEVKQVTSKEDGAWVKQAREHGPKFEVPDGHTVKGVSALVDEDGRTIQQWVKTQAGQAQQTRDDLIAIFQEYRGKAEVIAPPYEACDEDLLVVYPFSDMHLGMLSWGRETGASWDLRIAHKAVLDSVGQLISCAPRADTAVLVDLGDYVHANDQSNETPAHHFQLDVDGRFPKIGREAMRLRVAMIELALQKHEHVIYRGLPGNHDPEVAQLISIAMSLLFENNPRVTIDDDPSEFWFYEFGVVMLCGNHGHKVKPEKLPGVMAAYKPESWGRTKVRQAFSGHIHHTRSGEDMGARWETLRTIAPRDAHSHSHGYSAGRELIAVTYHRERGLRMRQTVELL